MMAAMIITYVQNDDGTDNRRLIELVCKNLGLAVDPSLVVKIVDDRFDGGALTVFTKGEKVAA